MTTLCEFVEVGADARRCRRCNHLWKTRKPAAQLRAVCKVREASPSTPKPAEPYVVPSWAARHPDGEQVLRSEATWELVPCLNRGEVLREDKCDLCGENGVMYEVRACTKFGECSLIDRRKDRRLRDCLHCRARDPGAGLVSLNTTPPKPKRTGPIRVVFFSPGLLRGGAERWIVTLCKTWHGDVRATGVVLSDWAGSEEEFTDELTRCGVSVVASQNVPQKAPNSPAVRRFPTTAEAARSALAEADVVISWGWGGVCETLKEAGWTGPHIVVSHGACEWSVNLLSAPARGATHLAAVSEAAVASFPPDLQSRVRVVWNGIEADRAIPSRSRDEVRSAWGCGPDDILIGYVGRMAVSKRPEAVAEAVAAMRTIREQAGDTRRVRAVLVGDGTHRDLVQSACRKAAGDDCLFIPPPNHIGDAYGALDCLVLASPSEGMALVLCEAWAAGVPTVATPVGAIPELHREFGPLATIVPVDAPGQVIAAACEQAMSGDSHHTRAVALREFSAARMARRWADWLGEIIHAS